MNRLLYLDDQLNALRCSSVNTFEGEGRFTGLAIKLVVKGEERYHSRSKDLRLAAGHYLLGNSTTEACITIRGHEATLGVCIDLAPALLSSLAVQHFNEGEALVDFMLSEGLPLQQRSLVHSRLGMQLQQVAANYALGHYPVVNRFDFQQLALAALSDHADYYRAFRRLPGERKESRSQLLARLWSVREQLERDFASDIPIPELAADASMSAFAFIRQFKAHFGLSPHQYRLQCRLAFAAEALKRRQSAGEVALLAGFADQASFSKAFRTRFGVPPSRWK